MKRLLVCYPGWLSAGGLLLGFALIASAIDPWGVVAGVVLTFSAFLVPFAQLWIRE